MTVAETDLRARDVADAERQVRIVRQATRELVYVCVLATILIMSFYTYLKAVFPLTPYLKDVALFATAGAALLNLAMSERVRRPTVIDVTVATLAGYLVFQLGRTALILHNAGAAYYGFRLTFLPIALYFGLIAVDDVHHRRTIERIISAVLIAGVFITLAEAVLVTAGVIPRDLIFRIASVSESVRDLEFGGFMRPVGIAGTPHITGTFNVLPVAMLVFAAGDDRSGVLHVAPRWKRWLVLIAVTAVVVSTSRTAITILLVLLGVVVMRIGGRERLIALAWIVIPLGVLLYALWEWLWVSGTFQTYFNFIPLAVNATADRMAAIYDKSALLGFGYEVGLSAPVDTWSVPAENLETNSDLFFLQLFKMLGAVGLALFILLFLVVPMFLVMSRRHAGRVRAVAAAAACVALSFVHYNPLQSPPLAVAAWYLLAYLSGELKHRAVRASQRVAA